MIAAHGVRMFDKQTSALHEATRAAAPESGRRHDITTASEQINYPNSMAAMSPLLCSHARPSLVGALLLSHDRTRGHSQ